MNDFIVIAHRGFSSKAPENTIAAFDLAVEQGFTNIELDVQLTADNNLVVIHDDLVDRTTNNKGLVRSFKLDELQAFDAGSWFDTQFANEQIPTLQAVLERYAGKIHLHLELKSNEAELAVKVAELLKDCGWLSNLEDESFAVPGLTITSAKVEQIERSLKLLPNIGHHWLCWELNEQIIQTALAKGFSGVCISSAAADQKLVDIAKAKGLTMRGLDVKTDDDIRALITEGVQGTTTNWPDRAALIKKELFI
jgi:glycerophosphoryl diester phosphodiesterase